MAVTKPPCRSRSLCFTCSLLFVLLHQIVAKRELKFAVLVFRHGDRTPIENFPTDLHKEREWPQGFGQLTKIGMRQQHELGQYTRNRYSKFLSDTYNRKQVYIQSTDYDRTLMSAQTYLAGLFPPIGNEIWNPRILWQPIPVHTRPRSADKMLHFPIPNCPRYDELQNETQASSELQNRIQPYLDFLQNLAVNSGYEIDILKTVSNFKIWNTYDTLLCESIHNYTLPEWATKDFMDKMKKLTELSLLSLFGIYKTEEKSRLQGGVLVNDILKNIKKAANPSNKRKLRIYSAHDTTIGALQVALNIFNGKLPPYSACQFFELYQESSGQYSIEMYYRNDTSKDPYLLTLPGCTPACPLEKFAELVSPVLVEDWSKACGIKDIMREIFLGLDFVIAVLFVFNLVLLYLFYQFGRCRRRNTYENL